MGKIHQLADLFETLYFFQIESSTQFLNATPFLPPPYSPPVQNGCYTLPPNQDTPSQSPHCFLFEVIKKEERILYLLYNLDFTETIYLARLILSRKTVFFNFLSLFLFTPGGHTDPLLFLMRLWLQELSRRNFTPEGGSGGITGPNRGADSQHLVPKKKNTENEKTNKLNSEKIHENTENLIYLDILMTSIGVAAVWLYVSRLLDEGDFNFVFDLYSELYSKFSTPLDIPDGEGIFLRKYTKCVQKNREKKFEKNQKNPENSAFRKSQNNAKIPLLDWGADFQDSILGIQKFLSDFAHWQGGRIYGARYGENEGGYVEEGENEAESRILEEQNSGDEHIRGHNIGDENIRGEDIGSENLNKGLIWSEKREKNDGIGFTTSGEVWCFSNSSGKIISDMNQKMLISRKGKKLLLADWDGDRNFDALLQSAIHPKKTVPNSPPSLPCFYTCGTCKATPPALQGREESLGENGEDMGEWIEKGEKNAQKNRTNSNKMLKTQQTVPSTEMQFTLDACFYKEHHSVQFCPLAKQSPLFSLRTGNFEDCARDTDSETGDLEGGLSGPELVQKTAKTCKNTLKMDKFTSDISSTSDFYCNPDSIVNDCLDTLTHGMRIFDYLFSYPSEKVEETHPKFEKIAIKLEKNSDEIPQNDLGIDMHVSCLHVIQLISFMLKSVFDLEFKKVQIQYILGPGHPLNHALKAYFLMENSEVEGEVETGGGNDEFVTSQEREGESEFYEKIGKHSKKKFIINEEILLSAIRILYLCRHLLEQKLGPLSTSNMEGENEPKFVKNENRITNPAKTDQLDNFPRKFRKKYTHAQQNIHMAILCLKARAIAESYQNAYLTLNTLLPP